MAIPICIVSEDRVSEFLMLKMLHLFEGKYYVSQSYGGSGNGYIKTTINGFNQAAVALPFFVLTDLDRYECAPSLIGNWLKGGCAPNLIFRVAVREAEAWLLADIQGLSRYSVYRNLCFLTGQRRNEIRNRC